MLVVIPVSKHDEGLLDDFCGAVHFFGPYPEHSLLIVARPSNKELAEKVASVLCNGATFRRCQTFIFSEDGPDGWPQGPNFYWTETISYLAEQGNTSPWLWMEMDTTPVEEGWLNDLESEYLTAGAACLGVLHKGEFDSAPHLAGVAVYPPRLDLVCQSWRYVTKTNSAFDIFCAHELVPIAAQTKLLQHNFRTGGYRCTKDGLKGVDLQKHHMGATFAAAIKPETRLVHGCNDGSLARVFSQKPNPKVYTYFEDIKFEGQVELLNLWVKNWGMHGFEPVVLGPENAESHPYYEEFMDSINRVHLAIMQAPLGDYGKTCYKRWIAYAGVKNEAGFSVADYDVFNKDFVERKFEKLTFFNWRTPCFAYGTSSQYLEFCKNMASILYQSLKQTNDASKFRHFHDQEFLCSYGDEFPNLHMIPWHQRLVSLHGENPQRELIHVAHCSVRKIIESKPFVYDKIKFDDLRALFASEYVLQ